MSSSVGPSYFYEDEVYRVGKSGDVEFGMVTENWEMYSSSDEEDIPGDKVLPGHVCVSWYPKGKEEVLPEAKVKLSARSLMPGDVVRRLIAGKDTQRGYCRSVKVRAAVQVIGTKKVIPNISANDLIPVQKLTPEVAVYLDTWIGVIRDMKYRLHLKLADNSTCEVDSTCILEHFEDVRRGFDSFSSSEVFYPGQKLKGPMRFLKNADWVYCSDDMKRAKDRKYVTVVVTDVVPSQMVVQWQWQTPECPLEAPPENIEWQKNPPPDTVKGDTLKRVKTLNLFESCTVQLGDVSYYNPKPGDVFIEKVLWRKSQPIIGEKTSAEKLAKEVEQTKEDEDEKEKNKIDSSEEGLGGDIDSLHPNDSSNTAEELMDTSVESGVVAVAVGVNPDGEKNNNNLPKGKRSLPRLSTKALRKKKLKKARPTSTAPPSIIQSLASQVVVETVHTNALVDVVWQDGTYEEGVSSVELYPIHHLDDHEFFPGDFVIRADSSDPRTYGVIQKMDHAERVAVVKWFEAYSYAGEQKPKELEEAEMSVFDIKDHPDFRFRPGTIVIRVANLADQSCGAGQIMDNYPDGQVRVWWANSTVTACWPQDLFRLGEYDSDEGEIWDDNGANSDAEEGEEDDDDAASDSSWVTETEEELNESQAGTGTGTGGAGPEGSAVRYQTIGKLIDKIQSTLVKTRETIVATGQVSIENENGVGDTPSVAKLVGNEQPSLTKKLLLIYKDCQYLDKMMGTKFFDVDDLKNWYKGKEGVSSKSMRMIEQISRMFDIPGGPAEGKTALRRLSAGSVGSDYQLTLSLSNSEPRLVSGSICQSGSQSSIPPPPLLKEETAGASATATAESESLEKPKESEESLNHNDDSAFLSGPGGAGVGGVTNSSNFLSYELCSIILNKLLKVHGEYQKRFGSGAIISSEEAAAIPLTSLLENQDQAEGETELQLSSDFEIAEEAKEHESQKKSKGSESRGESSSSSPLKSDSGVGKKVVLVEVQKANIIKELFSRLFKGDCVNVNVTNSNNGGNHSSSSSPSSSTLSFPLHKIEQIEVTLEQVENEKMDVDVAVPVDSSSSKDNPSASEADSDNNLETVIRSSSSSESSEGFIVIEAVPDTHRYRLTTLQPQNQKGFVRQVQKEVGLMRNSLPDGIYVKSFEERMDLFSVMIRGPEKTPYEDGLFFFDIQLPSNYPSSPPLVHYVSFCTDRLNPNLYEEGKVCVSLLGTWNGKGTEVWTSNSSILQLLVSIQGLILGPEPYYNEAGYEKQRGSQQGMENSRMYNEMVLIKLVQSMSRMLVNPPAPWEKEVVSHIQKYGPKMVDRYKKWLIASEQQQLEKYPPGSLPDFPLLPVSKGFSITLKKTLDNFAKLCATKQPSTTTTTSTTMTNNCTSSSSSSSSSDATVAESTDPTKSSPSPPANNL